MWKINFDMSAVQMWLNDHKASNIFKYESPIIYPATPFDIEITTKVCEKLKKIYSTSEEKGGIIFCKIQRLNENYKLQTVDVQQVSNVYENSHNDPYGSKLPCSADSPTSRGTP